MARIIKVALTEEYNKLHAEGKDHGEDNDCAVKAVALTAGVTYKQALDALRTAGRKPRKGAWTFVILKVIQGFGKSTKKQNPQEIISKYPGIHSTLKGITTHHPRRFAKVWPKGTFILFTSSHVAVVVDGIVHDWTINRAKRVESIYQVK